MQNNEFSIDQQEDEDLRCPICNFYFSAITKPYLLPCNHNLCLKCIDSIIGKKMLHCPICRKAFTMDDRSKIQVNFAFLNLVIKILKTKVIYCKRCSKIFNWVEHHSVCDQKEFKETNEIMEEITSLGEECYMILRYMDKHKNILQKSKKDIYDNTAEIMNVIKGKFYDSFQSTIDLFFQDLPDLNYDNYVKEMMNFLELCRPYTSAFNLNIDSLAVSTANEAGTTCVKRNISENLCTQNTKEIDVHYWDDSAIKYHQQRTQGNNNNNNTVSAFNNISAMYEPSLNQIAQRASKSPFRIFNKTPINELLQDASNKNMSTPKLNSSQEVEHGKESDCDITEEDPDVICEKNIDKYVSSPKNAFEMLHLTNSTANENGVSLSSPEFLNSNIVNFNCNFNIQSNINDNKQKIIVRNDKVEIINLEKESQANQDTNPASEVSINENNINMNINVQMPKLLMPPAYANASAEIENKARVNLQRAERHNSSLSYSNITEGLSKTDNNTKVNMHTAQVTPTPGGNHEIINKIISKFNKTKEITQMILNYTQKIEYTAETIKRQISSNYSHVNDKIISSLNGLYDNITVNCKEHSKRYLINLIDSTKKIWLFDSRNLRSDIKEFEFLKMKLNKTMGIEYDDSDLIFASGGKFSSGLFSNDEYSDQFLIFRWSNPRQCEVVGQMPRKRSNHGSIYYDNKLYIIGGCSGDVTKLKECESYNLKDKQWELLPSMNTARSNPGLCIYNQTYLYVFKGNGTCDKENSCHDTIEFLSIPHISLGWTLLTPEDPGMSWVPSAYTSATVLSEDKILICGGILPNKTLSSYTYIFDPVQKAVYRGKDLVKGACFNSIGVLSEKIVIVIDVTNETGKPFGAHVYDRPNNIWKFNHS